METYHLYYLPETENWCQAWLIHAELEEFITIVETDKQTGTELADVSAAVSVSRRNILEYVPGSTPSNNPNGTMFSLLGLDYQGDEPDTTVYEIPELVELNMALPDIVNYINTYHLIGD